MTENEPQPEKKGFFQRILDKFRSTSKEVADKVEDTISDVKNSEFGEKVADTARNIGDKAKDVIQDVKESEFADKVGDFKDKVVDKAKDMVQDVKESEFADKVGDFKDKVVDKTKEVGSDVSNFCTEKIKKTIGKIDFDKTLESLKEKQESSGKDLSGLINFVEKLQNLK